MEVIRVVKLEAGDLEARTGLLNEAHRLEGEASQLRAQAHAILQKAIGEIPKLPFHDPESEFTVTASQDGAYALLVQGRT